MISKKEIKFFKVLSYITTYFSILVVLTTVTLITVGFGALLGLVIFNFLKKMGNYNIKIGEIYNNNINNLKGVKLNLFLRLSKNYTLVQLLCYSITFFILIFIDGAFSDGLIVIVLILLMLIFNLLNLKFLKKIERSIYNTGITCKNF